MPIVTFIVIRALIVAIRVVCSQRCLDCCCLYCRCSFSGETGSKQNGPLVDQLSLHGAMSPCEGRREQFPNTRKNYCLSWTAALKPSLALHPKKRAYGGPEFLNHGPVSHPNHDKTLAGRVGLQWTKPLKVQVILVTVGEIQYVIMGYLNLPLERGADGTCGREEQGCLPCFC